MNILSVSTAEQGCSLAFFKNRQLVCEDFWKSDQTHSKRLMDMISQMLVHRAGIAVKDIDRFVVAKGPGSFTGVRIGISVMQGLSFAVSKPLVGISSLDGIAWQFSCSTLPVCVMMDARRSQVYTALYRFEQGRLVTKSEERALFPQAAARAVDGHAVFAGSGALAYRELIMENTGGKAVFASNSQSHVRASALIQAAYQFPEILENPEPFLTPVYLRKSDAELQFDPKNSHGS